MLANADRIVILSGQLIGHRVGQRVPVAQLGGSIRALLWAGFIPSLDGDTHKNARLCARCDIGRIIFKE